MNEEAQQELTFRYQTAVIIRGSLLLMVAVYAAVMLILRQKVSVPAALEGSTTGQMLLYTFAALSAGNIVLIKVLPPILRRHREGKEPPELVEKCMQEAIVVGFLSGVIAFFGLVFGMVTGRVAESLAFMGASVVVQLATWPKKHDWELFALGISLAGKASGSQART